ncbi:MAG: hypothetical protein IJ774_09505 [Selenomonadaceae bacterium]|nr:hypothetical protein [Selenomonadaceae bacterium]
MTEQEKINAEVQMKLALQDAKFESFIKEMKDFKTEMRDRDNQRAEDMREIRASISDMGKHVRNLSITAMAAIGAMVVTVIISLLRN